MPGPSYKRLELYKKHNLIKPVLGEREAFSNTPGGVLSVDRLLNGLPAFQSTSDNVDPKNKRLLLGKIDVPYNLSPAEAKIWKWQVLLIVRGLIEDGFEVYQYRDDLFDKPIQLTRLSLSTLFNFPSKNDNKALHSRFMHDDKRVAYDDVAMIDTSIMKDLLVHASPKNEVLFQSDLIELKLESSDISGLQEFSNFKQYVKNTIIGKVTDHDHALSKIPDQISVTDVIDRLLKEDEITEFQQQLISDLQYSTNPDDYIDLLTTLLKNSDTELLRRTVKTTFFDGTDALYFAAKNAPEKYAELLNRLIEKPSMELLKFALEAKSSNGNSALVWLAQKNGGAYVELLYRLDTDLLKSALMATQAHSGSDALALVAIHAPEKYIELLKWLIKKPDLELLKFALEAKSSNGHPVLLLLAQENTGAYVTLLDMFDADFFKIALKATNPSDGGSALYWLARDFPVEYAKLLMRFIEKPDPELLKFALEAKSCSTAVPALVTFACKNPEGYMNLLFSLEKGPDEFFKIALAATQPQDELNAISIVAMKFSQKYTKLLDILIERDNPELLKFALEAKDSVGNSSLICLLNGQIDYYSTLLDKLGKNEKYAQCYKVVLMATQKLDGFNALYSFALSYPEKYISLLETLEAKDPELLKFAVNIKGNEDERPFLFLPTKIQNKYEDLFKALGPNLLQISRPKDSISLNIEDRLTNKKIGSGETDDDERPPIQSGVDNDRQEKLDANTTFKKKTFNLNRIFYSLDSKPSPPPTNYRLSTFDKVDTEPESCLVDSVFTLKNEKDIGLVPLSDSTDHNKAGDSSATQHTVTSALNTRPSICFSTSDVYKTSLERPGQLNEAFYAKTTLQLCEQWQALPSLRLGETITRMHTEPSTEVEIQYSARDQLYYIRGTDKASKPVSIDYIVEMSASTEQTLTGDILTLVEYCKGFRVGDLNMSQYDSPTGKDYLKELALQKVGACRHRSGVFKALLDDPELRKSIPGLEKLSLLKMNARIIMNDCHTYIEVEQNDAWVRCDLGGYPGELKINDDANPLQQTEGVKTQKMLSATETVDSERLTSGLKTQETPPETMNKEPRDDMPVTQSYFSSPDKQIVPEPKAYIQSIIQKEEPKRLIECTPEQLPGLAYQLQAYCGNTSKIYHYIHSPDQLILRRPYVERQNDNSGVIKSGLNGPVYRFLSDENELKKTLIINFANFSAHDLVRFNTLLDEVPSIDGVPLPKDTKVIALIQSADYKDASLYSRFGVAVELCPVEAQKLDVPSPFQSAKIAELASRSQAESLHSTKNMGDDVGSEPLSLEIDFYGAPNWQAILLGTWRLKGDNLYFVPGILANKLEESNPLKKLILKNPPIADPDFTRFFQEANFRGYIEYQGKRLKWPSPTLEIRENLEFAREKIETIQYGPAPDKAAVINPSVFSRFFKQYHVEKTSLPFPQLVETDGILTAYKDQTLIIYITEDLNASQWSQLLAECKALNIQLQVNLAPRVSLPSQLSDLHLFKLDKFDVNSRPSTDYCIRSTDFDLTIASLQKDRSDVICIDVSELESSDLLVKVTGKFNEKRLALDFSQEDGALLVALSQGKTVILHGNFNKDMRQQLQDFLFERSKQTNSTGKVVIISDEDTANTFEAIVPIHDHNVTFSEKSEQLRIYQNAINSGVETAQSSVNEKIDDKLPYVTQQSLLRHQLAKISKEGPWVGLKGDLPQYQTNNDLDCSTAEAQTRTCNQTRLEAVQKILKRSPFVFLAGMTGVGKTSFVDNIWKAEGRILHVGEAALRQWAEDTSPGTKAIFIDEANITQKKWTQFEGLFHNDPPGMMIGNRYVELTRDHKIIFAGNPTTYSDDRTLPTLFERHGNSVVFEPLPSGYIYQEMLLPLFSQNNKALAEKICPHILSLNQFINGLSRDAILLTPRELIMMTQLTIHYCEKHTGADPEQFAKYFAYQLSRQFVPESHRVAFDKQFKADRPVQTPIQLPKDSCISITSSNRPSAQMLTDFLALRQSHTLSKTERPAGLGGVILEGEPGLGKSELAIACLRAEGFSKRSPDATAPPTDQRYFYHLPAIADAKVKREILIQAFHEGAVVLYDESNASASLESLLNRLLMGQDNNGEPAKTPGFMLIGTQNPSTMPGRSKTTTPHLHRMNHMVIPPYPESEMQDILLKMGLPDRRCKAIVTEYLEVSKNNKALCFRDVIRSSKVDLKALLGKFAQDITEADLLVLAQNASSHSDKLEAVYRHRLCNDEIRLAILQNTQADDRLFQIFLKENEPFKKLTECVGLLATKTRSAQIASLIIAEHFGSLQEEQLITLIGNFTDNQTILEEILEKEISSKVLMKFLENQALNEDFLKKIANKSNDDRVINAILGHQNLKSPTFVNKILNKTKITAAHLLVLAKNASSSPDTLEVIYRHASCNDEIRLAILQNTQADDRLFQIFLKEFDFSTESSVRIQCELLNNEPFKKLTECVGLLATKTRSAQIASLIIAEHFGSLQEEQLITLIGNFTDNQTILKEILEKEISSKVLIKFLENQALNGDFIKKIANKSNDDRVINAILGHQNLKSPTIKTTEPITSASCIPFSVMTKKQKDTTIKSNLHRLNVAIIKDDPVLIQSSFTNLCKSACTKRNSLSSFFGAYSVDTASAKYLLDQFIKNKALLKLLLISDEPNDEIIPKLQKAMLDACTATPTTAAAASEATPKSVSHPK